MNGRSIRVVLAENDEKSGKVIRRQIEKESSAEIVGEAQTGERVLELLEGLEPHALFLDLDIPGLGAMEVLRRAKEQFQDLVIVVVSGSSLASMTMKALSLGALEYVCKQPHPDSPTTYEDQIGRSVRNVKAVLIKHQGSEEGNGQDIKKSEALDLESMPDSLRKAFDLVVIGISTGGPAALQLILRNISTRDLPPILIVQHMGRLFTPQLAVTLTRSAGRPVVEAKDGMLLEPGSLILAPGGYHTEIGRIAPCESHHRIRIRDHEPVNGCRPSVDVTWRSVARYCKGEVLSILMTGMGEDGALGMKDLRDAGATCVAQDEASSVVWGMPRAAIREGLHHEVLSLVQIAQLVQEGIEKK